MIKCECKSFEALEIINLEMILFRDVIFKQFRGFLYPIQPEEKEGSQTMHFKTKVKNQEGAHLQEHNDGLEEWEEEEEEGSRGTYE